MKQNNKKFNNAMHKFVGVLDKYDPPPHQELNGRPLTFQSIYKNTFIQLKKGMRT